MPPVNATHIAPQGGGFEPQRAYDYEVELYGVPGQDVIRLAAQSMDLPKPNVGQIEINYGAERRKVAGQANFENQELVCVDYTDQAVYSSLLEWFKLVYNPETGLVGLASTYKKQGAVIMLAPDGSRPRVYTLEGIFPIRVEGDTLDYTNEDKLTVTCEISVDLAVPNF